MGRGGDSVFLQGAQNGLVGRGGDGLFLARDADGDLEFGSHILGIVGFLGGAKYSPNSSWRMNFFRRPRVAISLSTKLYMAWGPHRKMV